MHFPQAPVAIHNGVVLAGSQGEFVAVRHDEQTPDEQRGTFPVQGATLFAVHALHSPVAVSHAGDVVGQLFELQFIHSCVVESQ